MSEQTLHMPRLGETMEKGRIVRWLKAPGDSFIRGEALLEIETDKTVAELPAFDKGMLIEILQPDETVVDVGAPIARMTIEDDRHARPATAKTPATSPPSPVRSEPHPRDLQSSAEPAKGALRATPLARRIARDNGIDLASVTASGNRSRIEAADVRAKLNDVNEASPPMTAQRPAASMNENTLALGEGQLAYFTTGPQDGEPIFLLHGFASDHSAFAALAMGLARRGRFVVAVDLAGHGRTTLPAFDVDHLSTGLTDVITQLALQKPAHVVAHSLGVAPALALAQEDGINLSALTLIAPAGIGYEIDTTFIAGIAEAKTAGELLHLIRRLSVSEPAMSRTALAELATEMSKGRLLDLARTVSGPNGQRLDFLGAINSLANRLPVKVLFGLEDRILPWTQISALSPRVAIHLLARSGHMPHWDQTDDVLNILTG